MHILIALILNKEMFKPAKTTYTSLNSPAHKEYENFSVRRLNGTKVTGTYL